MVLLVRWVQPRVLRLIEYKRRYNGSGGELLTSADVITLGELRLVLAGVRIYGRKEDVHIGKSHTLEAWKVVCKW